MFVMLGNMAPSRCQSSTGTPAPPDQTPPAENASPQTTTLQTPDYVLYDMFFHRLANMERLASQEEAKGRDGNGYRDRYWQAAGLTKEEGTILRETALHCLQALEDLSAYMRAQYAERGIEPSNRLELPPGTDSPRPYETPTEIVNDHVAQLRRLLGDDTFAKLDHYIKEVVYKPGRKLAPNEQRLPVPTLVPNAPVNPNLPAKPER